MLPSCITFGSSYPYGGWATACGFQINGVQYYVNEMPLAVTAGSTMRPFVGFYTKDPLIYPDCGGSAQITINLKDDNTGSVLSTTSTTVYENTSYSLWRMPSFTMPSRDLNLKWEIIMNGQVATSTGTFNVYNAVCTDGETKCEDGHYFICSNKHWLDMGERDECQTQPECTSGQTKCVGTHLYTCVNGQWQDSGENQQCSGGGGSCISGQTKCVGTHLYTCVNGEWQDSGESPSCGGGGGGGEFDMKYILIGLVGVAAVGSILAALAFSRGRREEEYRPRVREYYPKEWEEDRYR